MMHTEKRGSLVKFITCMTSGGRDFYWEKRNRKTARLGKSPGIDMLAQASILVTFCVLGFLNCARAVPSSFYLTSRM